MPIINIPFASKPEPEQTSATLQFFQTQEQYGEYCFTKNQTVALGEIQFHFDERIFFSPSDTGSEYYLHSMGDMLGKGAFGEFWDIKKTIKINEMSYETANYSSSKAVKVQHYCSCQITCAHANQPAIFEKEYRIAARVPHLNVQEPINNRATNHSLMIMNKLKGDDLFTVLNEGPILTNAQRSMLCLGILKAVKEQAFDLNIIHRDLKPENMIVDWSTNPVSVKLIDYGLSAIIPEGATGVVEEPIEGTLNYLAPEVYHKSALNSLEPYLQTDRIDVFSVGRILVETLRGDDPSYSAHCTREAYNKYLHEDLLKLDNILSLFGNLLKDKQMPMQDLLKRMLTLDPNERISISEALSEYTAIHESMLPLLKHPQIPQLDDQQSFRLRTSSGHSLSDYQEDETDDDQTEVNSNSELDQNPDSDSDSEDAFCSPKPIILVVDKHAGIKKPFFESIKPKTSGLFAPTPLLLPKVRAPQMPSFEDILEDDAEESIEACKNTTQIERDKPATFRPIHASSYLTFFGKPEVRLSDWSSPFDPIAESVDEEIRQSNFSLDSGVRSGFLLTPQPVDNITPGFRLN